MTKDTIHIKRDTIDTKLEIEQFESEGEYYIACPSLDTIASGRTEKEAKDNFIEVMLLYYEVTKE